MLFNCPTYGWNVRLCSKLDYLRYFWDIPIGITRGLDGCEGKTIKAIYPVTVETERTICNGDWDLEKDIEIDTYFIEFTDGDRRLLSDERAKLRGYDVEEYLESGFITKDEAQAIAAGREVVEAEHREQSIAAAEAADRAAYERLKARYEAQEPITITNTTPGYMVLWTSDGKHILQPGETFSPGAPGRDRIINR